MELLVFAAMNSHAHAHVGRRAAGLRISLDIKSSGGQHEDVLQRRPHQKQDITVECSMRTMIWCDMGQKGLCAYQS